MRDAKGEVKYGYRILKMRKTAILLSLLLIVVLGIANAWAVPLAPSGFVFTSGTTVAARPELAGTAIVDELKPFSGVDSFGNEYFKGMLQVRIVEEDLTGTLDFYYRLFDVAAGDAGTDGIARLSMTDFIGFDTDVDWRSDGLGTDAPTFATRSASGSTISFNFLDTVEPGEESRFMFIKTDAFYYTTGSTVLIDGGVATVRSYAPSSTPVPEPTSLLLIGSGLLGIGILGRKVIGKGTGQN